LKFCARSWPAVEPLHVKQSRLVSSSPPGMDCRIKSGNDER
jgi:hypothetical protein